MAKIICEWMMCKHNTSNIFEVPGECTADCIKLEDIKTAASIYGEDFEVEDIGVKCSNFSCDKTK